MRLVDETNSAQGKTTSPTHTNAPKLDRLAVAETLVRDINERLRACWSQSIQPAKMELERCLLEWNASFNGMPSAAEKARRAEEVVRNVERLHARARQSVVLAREAHEAASNDLIFPPLLCDDYGALVGAEHRARMAYGTAARGLENVRLQVVASRAAANRAADLVGGCDDGSCVEMFVGNGGGGGALGGSRCCLPSFSILTVDDAP